MSLSYTLSKKGRRKELSAAFLFHRKLMLNAPRVPLGAGSSISHSIVT